MTPDEWLGPKLLVLRLNLGKMDRMSQIVVLPNVPVQTKTNTKPKFVVGPRIKEEGAAFRVLQSLPDFSILYRFELSVYVWARLPRIHS
jgi:hypothetical protein